jgi:hypothetical protein
MRRLLYLPALIAGASGTLLGTPIHLTIDASSLTSQDIQLNFSLYDNSDTIGDSSALVDNVTFGAAFEAFESGTIGSFVVDAFNPDSVAAVPGTLNGSGSWMLAIDEDLYVTPTITWRDYSASSAATIGLDLDFLASTTPGFFGYDQLVISLLDPSTFNPLVPGLYGFGDVFQIDATGYRMTSEVMVGPVVPEPTTVLLLAAGLPAALIARFRRTKK